MVFLTHTTTSKDYEMANEKQKEYQRKWKKENRERINRRARERYQESDKRYRYSKKYQENNKERINRRAKEKYTSDGRWRKQLRDRFGITAEQYWSMHADQEGLCAICNREQCVGTKLDVDHDHKTGRVRALLCRHCNTGIGLLKDSLIIVGRAFEYLLKYKEFGLIV